MFLRDPLRSGCHAARNILNNFKLSKFWSACYAVVPGVFRPNVQHTLHNFGSSTKDSSKPWKHKEMQLRLTNIVEAKLCHLQLQLYCGYHSINIRWESLPQFTTSDTLETGMLPGGEQPWTLTFYLKSIAMDSVQLRKVEPLCVSNPGPSPIQWDVPTNTS